MNILNFLRPYAKSPQQSSLMGKSAQRNITFIGISTFIFSTCRSVETDFCNHTIEDSVYWHTIIIGLACIPTSFWLPLCVHRLGAKFFLGKYLGSLHWRSCPGYYSKDRSLTVKQTQNQYNLHAMLFTKAMLFLNSPAWSCFMYFHTQQSNQTLLETSEDFKENIQPFSLLLFYSFILCYKRSFFSGRGNSYSCVAVTLHLINDAFSFVIRKIISVPPISSHISWKNHFEASF